MHTGYFSSWPPRVPTSPGSNVLIETLGDLHQSRAPSAASTPHSPHQPHAPQAHQAHPMHSLSPLAQPTATQPRINSHTASRSTSAPTSPRPDHAPMTSFPSGTDLVAALETGPTGTGHSTGTAAAATTARPTRPFSADSIKTDSITLRNTVAGGLLSSPTSIPAASYLPHYVTSGSTNHQVYPPGINTGSTATEPLFRDYPASGALYGDPPVPATTFRSNSGSNTRRPQSPELVRPLYHPFMNMGLMQPSRSISFSAASNNRLANSPGPLITPPVEVHHSPFMFSTNLRKSQTTGGKSAKKGIKNRLRKLRRKQGSTSRDATAFITSGESDSEVAFETEPDPIFNSGGITNKFVPSATGSSKSSLSSRPRLFHNDSGLPPQLPPRNTFSFNITPYSTIANTTTGQSRNNMFGQEHGHEVQKESSAVRFKDLLKSVGLSNQNSAAHPPTFPSTSDPHGTYSGAVKPLQMRSTFPLFGDFLSGDDQPSSSKGFNLKGPGRRKRRFTKKSHSAAAGMLAPFTATGTDDEDSSASRSHRHNPRHHHHGFLHHLHPRHRSRSIEEEGRRQFPHAWRQSSHISTALKEARQANPDPNLLLVELEPLPANFVHAFAALSASQTQNQLLHHRHQYHHPYYPPQGPLVPHITPSSTAGSGLASVYSAPIGTLTTYQSHPPLHRSPAKCSDTIGTKSFLFRSYENSKFQGYYIFRVVGDRVEYKKLPVAMDQPCSQYFREAYVTYRALEKKAKTLREERERRRVSQFWTRGEDLGDLREHSEPLPRPTKEQSQVHDELERNNSEGTILKSAIAWDQMRISDATTLTESPLATPAPLSSGRTTGYLDQRYSPASSSSAVLRRIAGGPDRSRSEPTEQNRAIAYFTNISTNNSASSQPLPRSALYHSRKRSWSSIKEKQRLEQQQQQAIEEAGWKEMERKHREEFQHATYGLELYLTELIKGLEYERFDIAADVALTNENRDTAVFSIVNGDRTNMMWLESPSVKLKHEFMNWIAISVMDHGDVDSEPIGVPHSKSHQGTSLDMFMSTARRSPENDVEDADSLIEMIDISLAQQEDKLQAMRESIQNTLREVESHLDQLDHLDENAKKLMTTMIRALDSQEVQLALRPSPSTGLTLAETVEWKLKDVNERIVICTRIMGAARFNLNRLRYEIELEQRSIRLFRQYKIIIAVVSIAIVFMVSSLYQSHAGVLGPQSGPTHFAAPIKHFEADYRFPHGEPEQTLYQHVHPEDVWTGADRTNEGAGVDGDTLKIMANLVGKAQDGNADDNGAMKRRP